MARIRAIKPEFWSSPNHPESPWARLLFIALWNWADDAGVGTANLRELAGFAFPNDPQIQADCTVGAVSAQCADTAPCLRHMCAALSAHYGVKFYTVDNRPYYAIPTWREHQKFDSRRTGKHPSPDQAETWIYQDEPEKSAHCADTAPTVRPHSGANTAPEHRNRGTGEQGNPPALHKSAQGGASAATRETRTEVRLRALNSTARSSEADQVASAYRAWAGGTIPSQTLIEVAQEVDQLIADGIPAHQIADGIKAWHGSDRLYASQLPHFVAKAARPTDATATKATHRAVDTLTQAEQIIAELETA